MYIITVTRKTLKQLKQRKRYVLNPCDILDFIEHDKRYFSRLAYFEYTHIQTSSKKHKLKCYSIKYLDKIYVIAHSYCGQTNISSDYQWKVKNEGAKAFIEYFLSLDQSKLTRYGGDVTDYYQNMQHRKSAERKDLYKHSMWLYFLDKDIEAGKYDHYRW